MIRALTAATTALMLLALPVSASSQSQDEINATLGGDPDLWDGLFAVALADQIRENCDTIQARSLRATAFIYDLYSTARGYGFSRAEIRAFQVDDGTAERMRAQVHDYFDENGVREDAPETYCVLGLAEIAAETSAGTLLRAR